MWTIAALDREELVVGAAGVAAEGERTGGEQHAGSDHRPTRPTEHEQHQAEQAEERGQAHPLLQDVAQHAVLGDGAEALARAQRGLDREGGQDPHGADDRSAADEAPQTVLLGPAVVDEGQEEGATRGQQHAGVGQEAEDGAGDLPGPVRALVEELVDQRRVGLDIADAEDQAALDRMAVVGHDPVGGDVRAVGQVVLQVDLDHLAVRPGLADIDPVAVG